MCSAFTAAKVNSQHPPAEYRLGRGYAVCAPTRGWGQVRHCGSLKISQEGTSNGGLRFERRLASGLGTRKCQSGIVFSGNELRRNNKSRPRRTTRAGGRSAAGGKKAAFLSLSCSQYMHKLATHIAGEVFILREAERSTSNTQQREPSRQIVRTNVL